MKTQIHKINMNNSDRVGSNPQAILDYSQNAKHIAQLNSMISNSVNNRNLDKIINNNNSIQLMSDNLKTHIFEGELNKAKDKVVGYHSTARGDKSFAKKAGNNSGNTVYSESVVERHSEKKKLARIKDEPSTFFPDNWTEGEIEVGVDNAYFQSGSNEAEATVKNKGSCIVAKCGNTVFPKK